MTPTRVIVHCTATPDGREVADSLIEKWHIERGMKRIGYHRIVHLDGMVSNGRPLDEKGAHCLGHNDNSIGIALVGNVRFTEKQVESLVQQYLMFRRMYFIMAKDWFCHNEFTDEKTCPNFSGTMLRGLLQLVECHSLSELLL